MRGGWRFGVRLRGDRAWELNLDMWYGRNVAEAPHLLRSQRFYIFVEVSQTIICSDTHRILRSETQRQNNMCSTKATRKHLG